jgi:hypothetical protein
MNIDKLEWEELRYYIKGMRSQSLDGSETETTCSHILRKMEELEK